MRMFFALIAAIVIVPTAMACSCLGDTTSWWRRSKNVLVVRVDTVYSDAELYGTRKKCARSEPICIEKQVARYTLIETIKGSNAGITTLASRYGGASCGIPLLAGGYYVVFLKEKSSDIGTCNTAGPYLVDGHSEGRYPKPMDAFVSSLRKVAKDPKSPIAPRPQQSWQW